MSKRWIILAAVIVLMPWRETRADGREVDVFLKSGGHVTGAELIAVRSSALLLARERGLTERQLKRDTAAVELIPLDQIDRVTIKKNSHVLTGVVVGLPLGMVVGGLIAALRPVMSQRMKLKRLFAKFWCSRQVLPWESVLVRSAAYWSALSSALRPHRANKPSSQPNRRYCKSSAGIQTRSRSTSGACDEHLVDPRRAIDI